jgi:pyruvate kinase
MNLPGCQTRIVATIGPASESPAVLEQLIRAGMNVARLNFSHGEFAWHQTVIERIRAAARATGHRVAIMADLPGPKMRIGQLSPDPVELKRDDTFTLTTDNITGNQTRVAVSFPQLPQVVKPGDKLFLNDGLVQLKVVEVRGPDIVCRVIVGGELRSRKGLNLPGIQLGLSAFTERDHECLRFALAHGVDAISQSFVETAADIAAVRRAAAALGHQPFLIAKIERAGALTHLDEILHAADGVMVARGDLGVETPIERIALVQKDLLQRATRLGKPVITATQMLESMTASRLPTRAEATDVANAVLDGTDAVMLSAESATGRFPVEAVNVLARIATATETYRPRRSPAPHFSSTGDLDISDVISLSVENFLTHLTPAAVLVPTRTGRTARMITRFKLPVWIVAASAEERVCQALQFSFGVHPEHTPEPPDWNEFARDWVCQHQLPGEHVLLVAGPSPAHPHANHRLEDIRLSSATAA